MVPEKSYKDLALKIAKYPSKFDIAEYHCHPVESLDMRHRLGIIKKQFYEGFDILCDCKCSLIDLDDKSWKNSNTTLVMTLHKNERDFRISLITAILKLKPVSFEYISIVKLDGDVKELENCDGIIRLCWKSLK